MKQASEYQWLLAKLQNENEEDKIMLKILKPFFFGSNFASPSFQKKEE